jgi:DMSO reductase anchor subunit
MAVAGEAGRPLRARFLLGNLRRSWMSRETLAAMVFVPFALLTAFIQSPFASGVAAVAAVIFILSQGFILYRSRAVAAWNTPMLPVLFVTSALVSGSGLLLAFPHRMAGAISNAAVLMVTVILSSADLLIWTFYLYWPASDGFQATTQSLRSGRSMLWSIGVGRVWPTLIVMLPLVIPDTLMTSGWSLTIAGLALFVGSWTQKSGIIRGCGYLRPIGLQLQVSQPASFKTSTVVGCNRL